MSKQRRLTFPKGITKVEKPFDLIHTDLWGPYKVKSYSGAHYFLTIVDDFTRCKWTYLLHDKTQVYKTLKKFFALINTQFNRKVKVLRSDNGTEFMNHKMDSFLRNNGIIHQRSNPHTPQQNGIAEIKHRHVLDLALRTHTSLPIHCWGECILTATYLINLIPSRVLNWEVPYTKLFNKRPPYSFLKVFGCLSYAPTYNWIRQNLTLRHIGVFF